VIAPPGIGYHVDAMSRCYVLSGLVLFTSCATTKQPQTAQAEQKPTSTPASANISAGKDANAVVEAALAEAGGREKLLSVKDLTLSSYMTTSGKSGRTVQLKQYVVFPNMERTEMRGSGKEMIIVITKDVAFRHVGGVVTDLPAPEAEAARQQLQPGIRIPTWIFLALSNPEAKLALKPPLEENGRRLDVIETVDSSGEPLAVYVDANSHLLVRIRSKANDTEFEDWRTISGLRYPFKARTKAKQDVSIEVEEVKFNSDVSPELFKRP
jgi:outer membrane lipoprotein-sorting protein